MTQIAFVSIYVIKHPYSILFIKIIIVIFKYKMIAQKYKETEL